MALELTEEQKAAGWQHCTVGGIANVVTGSTPSKNNPEHWGNEIPFLTPSDQNAGTRSAYTARSLSYEGREAFQKRIVGKGAVAVTCIGATIGKVSYIRADTVTNQQINSIVADEKNAHGLYLYYLFMTLGADLLSIASGSATPIVSKRVLENLELVLPPLVEQKRIAEILGSVDDKIEANSRLLDSLDELLRLEYVRSTSNRPALTISDIAVEVKDSISPDTISNDDLYVGLEHLPRRNVWLREWGRGEDITSNKSRFKRGDILFGKLRPYFHKVVVAPADGICSTDIIVVRPKPGYEKLALQVLSSDEVVAHATNASNGTRMPRTKWADLRDLEVRSSVGSADPNYSEYAISLILENQSLASTRDLLIRHLVG